jgi:hypothetical protein
MKLIQMRHLYFMSCSWYPSPINLPYWMECRNANDEIVAYVRIKSFKRILGRIELPKAEECDASKAK